MVGIALWKNKRIIANYGRYNNNELYNYNRDNIGRHLYADDVALKINYTIELYPKRNTSARVWTRYRVGISWGEVLIVIKQFG